MARRSANLKKPAKSGASKRPGSEIKGQFSPGLERVRKAFFARKPVRPEQMTPLQKRMQSGGPPIEPAKLK
jgi:hypothetical protein